MAMTPRTMQRPRADESVALRDALLDEVADHDEQDEVEGLHRAELAAPDRARDDEQEEEDDDGAQGDVHGQAPCFDLVTDARNGGMPAPAGKDAGPKRVL